MVLNKNHFPFFSSPQGLTVHFHGKQDDFLTSVSLKKGVKWRDVGDELLSVLLGMIFGSKTRQL